MLVMCFHLYYHLAAMLGGGAIHHCRYMHSALLHDL